MPLISPLHDIAPPDIHVLTDALSTVHLSEAAFTHFHTEARKVLGRKEYAETEVLYNTLIAEAPLGTPKHILSDLHFARAQVLCELGRASEAYRHLLKSFELNPICVDVRHQLAILLLNRRSYRRAYEITKPLMAIEGKSEAVLMHMKAQKLMEENRTGNYHIYRIWKEAELDFRLDHADYVCPTLRILHSKLGGRGLYATTEISAGQLLIVAKAVTGEVVTQTGKDIHLETDFGYTRMSDLTAALISRIGDGRWRKILALCGGRYQESISISLDSEDILADITFEWTSSEVEEIAKRNAFRWEPKQWFPGVSSDRAEGRNYLFYAPSFLNHSCFPNVGIQIVGDTLFARSLKRVPENTELTCTYLDNSQPLQYREAYVRDNWGFICHCELCKHGREKDNTVKHLEHLFKQIFEEFTIPKDASENELDRLIMKSLRLKIVLYKLVGYTEPPLSLSSDPSVLAPLSPSFPVYSIKAATAVYQKLSWLFFARSVYKGPQDLLEAARLKVIVYLIQKSSRSIGHPFGWVAECIYITRIFALLKNRDGEKAWTAEARRISDKYLGQGFFRYGYSGV